MVMTPMVQSLKNHQKKNPSIGKITWGSPKRIWVSSPSEFCFPRCSFQDTFKTPIFESRTSKPQKKKTHNHRGGWQRHQLRPLNPVRQVLATRCYGNQGRTQRRPEDSPGHPAVSAVHWLVHTVDG